MEKIMELLVLYQAHNHLSQQLRSIQQNVEEDELVKLRSMTHDEVRLLRFTSMEEGEN
ncbi:hypothetical protein LINPERPRIM_LOCUS14527 [Linum perenne]